MPRVTRFLSDANIIVGIDANNDYVPIKVNTDGTLNIVTSTSVDALKHRVYTPVVVGDVGADYVSGSEGMIKTIKEYPIGASVGEPAILTTFKYQNATYPTFITDEIESETTV